MGGAAVRSEKGEVTEKGEMKVGWVKLGLEKLRVMVGEVKRGALDAIKESKESMDERNLPLSVDPLPGTNENGEMLLILN